MKFVIPSTRSLGLAFAFFQVCVASYPAPTHAQAPAPAQKQTTGTGPINLTAKSANVTESGTPVKVSILRWSTAEERNPVVAALDPAAQAAAFVRAARVALATRKAALRKAATVGYLWTNEVVGYSIKYAYRTPLPDGGERIILATDRRLGAGTAGWKQVATGTPTDYEFTLIEIRMDSKGLGEGKASLTSKVILDNEAKTLALDNYAATPAILQNVKR